jgi:sulfite reductase (ferredoxin)
LLGGGQGSLGDKILKLPSRIAPDALRKILNHFLENRKKGEAFNAYYQRFGKAFFYGLLKPLSEVDAQDSLLFVDFEREELFKTEIGVGECAWVKIDLVATLITEAGEKIEAAKNALNSGRYADSLYHSYSSVVQLAKARLLSIEKQPSTQEKIIRAFEEHFNPEAFGEKESFSKGVLAISSETPGYQFAQNYLESTLRLFEKFGSQNN